MLGIIAGNMAMLIAMWIVLILVGLNVVFNLLQQLRGTADFDSLATAVTRPLLVDILPLILLSLLTAIDRTHILILIWYYVAAAVIAIRSLFSLSRGLKK